MSQHTFTLIDLIRTYRKERQMTFEQARDLACEKMGYSRKENGFWDYSRCADKLLGKGK